MAAASTKTKVLIWDMGQEPLPAAAPARRVARPAPPTRFRIRLWLQDGTSFTVRPGQEVWIGRHGSCSLVVDHCSVSRFHACLRWDVDQDRPFLTDASSSNGVTIDGRAIQPQTPVRLRGGEELRLGQARAIRVELVHGGLTAPALLGDRDEAVMFSDGGPCFTGVTHGQAELHRVLLALEARKRTATVHLSQDETQGCLTLCLGRVVAARTTTLEGMDALNALLALEQATVEVERVVEPEECTLDASIREVLGRDGVGTKKLARPVGEDVETTHFVAPFGTGRSADDLPDSVPEMGGTMFLLQPDEVWRG